MAAFLRTTCVWASKSSRKRGGVAGDDDGGLALAQRGPRETRAAAAGPEAPRDVATQNLRVRGGAWPHPSHALVYPERWGFHLCLQCGCFTRRRLGKLKNACLFPPWKADGGGGYDGPEEARAWPAAACTTW